MRSSGAGVDYRDRLLRSMEEWLKIDFVAKTAFIRLARFDLSLSEFWPEPAIMSEIHELDILTLRFRRFLRHFSQFHQLP
jgi:hypothetical protein